MQPAFRLGPAFPQQPAPTADRPQAGRARPARLLAAAARRVLGQAPPRAPLDPPSLDVGGVGRVRSPDLPVPRLRRGRAAVSALQSSPRAPAPAAAEPPGYPPAWLSLSLPLSLSLSLTHKHMHARTHPQIEHTTQADIRTPWQARSPAPCKRARLTPPGLAAIHTRILRPRGTSGLSSPAAGLPRDSEESPADRTHASGRPGRRRAQAIARDAVTRGHAPSRRRPWTPAERRPPRWSSAPPTRPPASAPSSPPPQTCAKNKKNTGRRARIRGGRASRAMRLMMLVAIKVSNRVHCSEGTGTYGATGAMGPSRSAPPDPVSRTRS